MKDFLLTMMALQTSPYSAALTSSNSKASSPPSVSAEEVVHLYFSIFDIDDSGYIELKDFKLALSCLLDSAPVQPRPPSSPVQTKRLPAHPLAASLSSDNNDLVQDHDYAAQLELAGTSTASVSPVTRRMSVSQVMALDDVQVEELFHAIDVTNSGRISMQEFQRFYETVIVTSADSSMIYSGNNSDGIS
jgi:Ca2+-binding EF-hand superfamily protein